MTLITFSTTFAQLDLPQASPPAMVKQTVGLTDITLEYSSPAVRGRGIWETLVPYGEVWRTGANKCTNITFSDQVEVGDKTISAGTYALFTIPNEDKWTIIINSDAEQWGAMRYDKEKDIVRFEVDSKESPLFHERMMFTVAPLDEEKGEITLWWADLSVSFMVNTDPVSQAVLSIQNTMAQANSLWYTYAQAAEYYLDHNQDLNQAMEWANQSISLREHFYNNWVKARLLMARNNTGGMSSKTGTALKMAKKAKEMGMAENSNFYKRLAPQIDTFIKKYSEEVFDADQKNKKKR